MDQAEVHVERDLRGVPNTYFDPILRNSPTKYAAFVRGCARIGMLSFTQQFKSELGIFFHQKEKRLRLILDCRASNILFHMPPFAELATGEGLSQTELEIDNTADKTGLRICGCILVLVVLQTVFIACGSMDLFVDVSAGPRWRLVWRMSRRSKASRSGLRERFGRCKYLRAWGLPGQLLRTTL